ncbi:phosphoglycerate kinase [Candidatus Peregrinibacteria bacterium]|jgi:3-phosphoglycerate kinase|nr:phosphoglycerate kinase [Candidatus Peregrinibacteria bacterium]
MALITLRDLDLNEKKVLMRVDFNVPLTKLSKEELGIGKGLEAGKESKVVRKIEVQDDTRIRAVLPTLQYILENGAARIVLMTHVGRPKGEVKPELSTKVVAEKLEELLGEKVCHVEDCIGVNLEDCGEGNEGCCGGCDCRVVMLENVRFHPEEKKGDMGFAQKLVENGDVFINDAFAVCHRDQASVTKVAEVMKEQGKEVAAGFLIEKEVEMLGAVLEKPRSPFVMIVSGAKVDTKIGMIQNFYDNVNTFILGGGIANTFLAAAGHNVADSLYEKDKLDLAREIMVACEENVNEIVMPTDGVVASELSAGAEALVIPVEDVEGDMRILDLGPDTIEKCVEILKNAEMIVWNGPVGVYEFPQFMEGTKWIAEAIAANEDATTVVGGGDTVDAINRLGIPFDKFTHVSTGGGSMVEFLEGKILPGIQVLMD